MPCRSRAVLATWHPADRQAWIEAMSGAADPFDDLPRIAACSTFTQGAVRREVSSFLAMARAFGFSDGGERLAELVTPAAVEELVRQDRGRVKVASTANRLSRLLLALELFDPGGDHAWLSDRHRRLRSRGRREPMGAKTVVHAGLLFRLGLKIMDDVDASLPTRISARSATG